MNDNFKNAYDRYFAKATLANQGTKKENISSNGKLHADGNISTIDDFAKILNTILNCVIGQEKVTFQPANEKTISVENTNFPLITYDVNSREVSEGKNIKPVLTDNFKEKNGNNDDYVQVYRQWYDCLVEFDIYSLNSTQGIKMTNKLEEILTIYTGLFKKAGISEMFFVKEIPPKSSVNYMPDLSMKSIIWYIRLEKIYTVRASAVKKITMEVNKLLENKMLNTTEPNKSVDIYNNNEITYKL